MIMDGHQKGNLAIQIGLNQLNGLNGSYSVREVLLPLDTGKQRSVCVSVFIL
jgi:hypothetical protein